MFCKRLCIVGAVVLYLGTASGEGPPISAEEIVQRMTEAADTLRDYRCRFVKSERIEGALREETMRYFYKRSTSCGDSTGKMIRMEWVTPHEGQVAVYRDGRMWAKRGGILGWFTFELDPHGDLAKGGSRHSIVESDLPDVIRRTWENIAHIKGVLSVLSVEEKREAASLPSRRIYEVELLSQDEPGKGYAYRAKLWVDSESGLPIRAEYYDWEDRLFERFLYEDLEVNVGIEEERFKL